MICVKISASAIHAQRVAHPFRAVATPLNRIPHRSRGVSLRAAITLAQLGAKALDVLDRRARAYEDGLEESVVYSTNALKADGAHELGDLCHRDREIRAFQNGGVLVNTV